MNLVTDLAIILIAAGIFTVISKALKQPLILGYIVAGFLVGPHMVLFPSVTSTESVSQWSEIGIIFLLFSLGLEFSFKKLIKVGASALITAGTKCIGMMLVGLIAGSAMGWTMMESIFLGGLLSMSSTTIIIKAYDDMGLKDKPYSTLIFGSLVFEDLIAVLLMVLLSTLAVSNKFAGGEMIFGLAKLAFFIILWFLVGIYLIPLVLKKAKNYLTDEILLIVGIGLCFGMVTVAEMVGFSSALGAFVMGSILAETVEGERIEHLTCHIKDLFGAIFFVSVGMMVDPAVIGEHWAPVLIITLVAMCGILIFSTAGALLSGQGLDTAVHAGFSLAQLGEFAFIIAGLGCSLGVMRDFIYPVIIAVSVVTTFTTPYMIKLADPVSAFLHRKLPVSLLAKIDPPQEEARAGSRAAQNEWKTLLKKYCTRVLLYGVILLAILLGAESFLDSFVQKIFPSWPDKLVNVVNAVVTIVVMLPFLYGIAVNGNSLKMSANRLMRENSQNKWPVLALILLRIAIATGFVVAVISSRFDLSWWALIVILAIGALFFIVARGSVHKFTYLEDQFIANLNEKEEMERLKAPVATSVNDKLAGYDVKLCHVCVSQDFQHAGKTLREMPFRHSTGVNIVTICRGSRNIYIPSGDERIFPSDVLLAVGTAAQLEAFQKSMDEDTVPAAEEALQEEFVVSPIVLGKDSILAGKTLRSVDMRAAGCMVISVLRDGKLHTNPSADMELLEGDKVWLAGLESGVKWFS